MAKLGLFRYNLGGFMLTEKALSFLSVSGGILLLSLLWGNIILLSLGLGLAFAILLGLLIRQPKAVHVESAELRDSLWVGEVVEVSHEVRIKEGVGAVILHQELPPEFELVEGSNLKACWKGTKELSFRWSYSVRCLKRGRYLLPEVEWESRHLMGLLQTRLGTAGKSREILVRPKIWNIRRVRRRTSFGSSPHPLLDIARLGVASTDFRELRDYRTGDPFNFINWKATAKQVSRGIFWPLVNEYEVEGSRAVWVFLDAGSHMEVGTSLENAFEYALEAAGSIIFYYLERGYRVGAYVYEDGGRLFYPDSGRRQFGRISRELSGLATSARGDDLPQAIDRCRRYILGLRPLVIILCRLDGPGGKGVVEGVRKLAALQGRRRRRFPLMVVSIPGYEMIRRADRYERYAGLLARLETRPLVRALRRFGASVLEWNPRGESFTTALLRQREGRWGF